MSWSISKHFRTKAEAIEYVRMAIAVPAELVDYIVTGISGIPDDSALLVEGSGHLCQGPNSWGITTCSLAVKPFVFESVAIPEPAHG